jgi:DNA-binding NarL/FixJ family response regulator
MAMTTIRVGIVDDDAIVRSALSGQLGAEPDVEVVFVCETGAQAVAEVLANAPDVVLMDVRMPELDGIGAAAEIRRASEHTKVLLMTAVDLDGDVAASIAAGASGFLIKSGEPGAVANAVRAVHLGSTVISPGPLTRWSTAPSLPVTSPAPSLKAPLTTRELEVLQLLSGAHSNAEIAEIMVVAESTVKTHVSSIMAKLGVSSRLKAVVRAHELGLVKERGE